MSKKITLEGLDHFKDNENAMIAGKSESTNTATVSHAVGEYFYWKGVLHIVTAAIAVGGTIQTNTNVKPAVLADDVSVLKESTNELKTALSFAPEAITSFTENKYINNRADVGETVSLTYNDSSSYKCVMLNVYKGDSFTITGLGGNAARLWCLTDEDKKVVAVADANVNVSNLTVKVTVDGILACDFYTTVTPSLTINRIVSSSKIEEIEDHIDDVEEKADDNSEAILKKLGGTIVETLTLVTGYVDYQTGTLSDYDDNNKYKRTNKMPIPEETYQISTNCVFNSSAGWAVYDGSQNYITGGTSSIIPIKSNYKYVAISSFNSSGVHTNKTATFVFKSVLNTVLSCWGDSITEGMYLDGNHSAEYGKAPYPAQITTILTDSGYTDFTVNNYGHGGECMPDIMARLGSVCAYFVEDVTVAGDGTPVQIGTYAESSGLRTDSKIQIPFKNKNGTNYNVVLTQLSHDTNPIVINGNEFALSISSQTIYLSQTSGSSITIQAGSLMFTADDRNSTVDIVFGGVNDATSLTLEIFLKFMKKVAEKNPRYLCIGCHKALFQYWSDIDGSTIAEKYVVYANACKEQMGVHFVDLYQEFYPVAMEYALEGGYFTDKTAEELSAMEALLEEKTIPAEFSYDGNHENNVHLNAAGYYVIARIIINRLNALNYISK